MDILGRINNRKVLYTHVWVDKNYLETLPTRNWLVMPISQEINKEIYVELAHKCLDKNVVFVSAVGKNCELIHDVFDEIIIKKSKEKGIDKDPLNGFEDFPLTTWNYNIVNGFWSAIYGAFSATNESSIKKVVCVDYTEKGIKGYLMSLIKEFKKGWLPPDNREYQEPSYDR
jgi:hypothetical protein